MAQQRGNFIYTRRVVRVVSENALTRHQVAALTGQSDVDIVGGNIQTFQTSFGKIKSGCKIFSSNLIKLD